MIYACHHSDIPRDHPEGSACIMPDECVICGEREPCEKFAGAWCCESCLRAYILGFKIGAFMADSKAVQRSLEVEE